jgi:flagellar biosynthetic protein FliQ
MTTEFAAALGQSALWTALLLSGPLLVVAMVVGTMTRVLRSVQQVEEPKPVYVPQILAGFLFAALLGSWMLQVSVAFGTETLLSF